MIQLYDLMIGDYSISQGFGDRPDQYSWIKDSAGKSILGHNGVDVATPTGVILLNPFPLGNEAVVTAVGFEPRGYGNFIRIWDKKQNCVILYGHCEKILVKVGDTLFFEQAVAITDNTGWSSGPHCHIGLYMVDSQGNKLNRENGYDGYLNAVSPQIVAYKILDPKQPANPPVAKPPEPVNTGVKIPVDPKDFEKLVTNSDNYQRVIDHTGLVSHADDTPAKAITDIYDALTNQVKDLQRQLDEARKGAAVTIQEVSNKDEQVHRLQGQLIEEESRHAAELKNIPRFDDLKKDYDKRYYDLYAKYEEAMKEKGAVLNDIAAIRVDAVEVVKSPAVQRIIEGVLSIFNLKW